MEDIKIKVNEPGTRVDEPIEEFVGDFAGTTRSVGGGVASLVGQVGRLYIGVLTLPLNLLPARSRYHAKNAVKESFLTIKVLVDEINHSIEHSLDRSLERDKVRVSMDDLDDEIPPATP